MARAVVSGVSVVSVVCVVLALLGVGGVAVAQEVGSLPVLARYTAQIEGYAPQMAWSPDGLRVAVTGARGDKYEQWVIVYDVSPSSAPLRVVEEVGGEDGPLVAWLNATDLVVSRGGVRTVWRVSGGEVKPLEDAQAQALSAEALAAKARAQCVRSDPARGVSVVIERGYPASQGLRWWHPMEAQEVALGVPARSAAAPCLSPDVERVVFVAEVVGADGMSQDVVVLADASKQAKAATGAAPTVWGAWTLAQVLEAAKVEGMEGVANLAAQVVPWPGRADAAALLVYGYVPRGAGGAQVVVLEDKGGALKVAGRWRLVGEEEASDEWTLTLEPSPEVLSDKEPVLRLRERVLFSGEVGDTSREVLRYLRWHGGAVEEVLSFIRSAAHDSCEGASEDAAKVRVLKGASGGFFDVSIDNIASYTRAYPDEGETEPKTQVERTTQTWRWDGARYQEVKAK